ncbi:MAG: CinA family nicotinamide mononucleotide deamidase-related protein [Gammaproteobacteria bacterium]
MRCEVIAIGTELLLGQITDTNSSWIGEQLALAGIDSLFQVKVGDNLERIVGCLQLALSRSQAVICCGGLGPTQDDITREAIARVMGVPLVRDEHIAGRIRAMFAARNRPMPGNNLLQADVPVGAHPIPQMPGTAPGLICPVGSSVIYAVPGVPSEMREMMLGTILPDLQHRAGLRAVIRSRVLRTWGHAESALAEMLAGRIQALDASRQATIAFLASGIEGIKVRVTAKAADEAQAQAILDAEEREIRAVVGEAVFGVDEQTMESVVLDRLAARSMTLAAAETATAGLLGGRLATAAGAAGVFLGAAIVNDPQAQARVLDVDPASVAVPERAGALAQAVRRRFGADVGIASTAIAAGAETPAFRAGTVFLGVALGDRIVTERAHLPPNPDRIREFSVIHLLNALRRQLDGAR